MTQSLKLPTRDFRSGALMPRMTYEQFLQSGFEQHVEWVDGEVVMMAPVSGDHSELGLFLLRVLGEFIEERGLGVLRYEPFNMKTGPELPGRSPDILVVAKKNLVRLKKTYLKGPADVVIEIVSPSSRGVDRGDKYYEYEKGGVREYWLIDPERERAEFYTLGADKRYEMIDLNGNEIFRSRVLRGFWLRVGWLWQRPLPRAADVLKRLDAE
jgi:Uma2 family endonuclease